MFCTPREPSRIFLLAYWIPAQFVGCAACLMLAARSYSHYSLFDHDISFLGHPSLNPRGWWYWSAGMGVGGLMLWPLTVYLARGMRALTAAQSAGRRRLVAAGTLAGRSACVGLLGLAVIPQSPSLDAAHQLAGVLAMGGLYVALWIFAGILTTSPRASLAKALFFGVVVGWGPAGFLLTQGWRYFAYGEAGHDVSASTQHLLLLRFSLWEWLLYFCLFPALVLVVCCVPEQKGSELFIDPIDEPR